HQEQVNDPFTKRGKNYGQLTIFLTPENQRKRKASEIITYLTNKANPDRPVNSTANINGEMYVTRNSMFVEKHNPTTGSSEQIQVSDEFIVGGNVLNNGQTYLGYDGGNTVFRRNLKTGQDEFRKFNKLRNYDSPIFFVAEPNGEFGILQTSLGYVMRIDGKDGSKKNLFQQKNHFTQIKFFPETKTAWVTTDKGSFEIYDYSGSDFEQKLSVNTGDSLLRLEGQKPYFEPKLQRTLPYVSGFTTGEKDQVYLAVYDGSVRELDLTTGKIVNQYYVDGQPILWIGKAGDNLLLSFSDRAVVYNVKTEKKLQTLAFTGKIMSQESINSNSSVLYGSNGTILQENNGNLQIIKDGIRFIEKVEFKQGGGGPPVGAPVQLEVKGDDFDILREIASFAKDRLYLMDGVYDIRDNWEIGKDEYHVVIDEALASVAGVSVSQIALSLQTAFEGRVATSIKETEQEVDIRVIFPENLREKLSSLNKVMVRNQIGNLVPITALASYKKYPGISQITHADWRRTIYVKANIDEQRNTSVTVNNELIKAMQPIMKKYPDNSMKAGGEYEDTQDSMKDLLLAMGVAVGVILIILVLQFGNLRHPRVVMTAIPLGLIGVSFAFFLHKLIFLPELVFSFLASMGIIGLSGVVVNDSIVLVDFINKLRKTGISKREAVIGAGVYRLRAVLLTTITTVFGLFPTAYGLGGDDPFLRPMALAMGWGLAFATFITLMVVPVYYSIWEDRGFVFHSVFSGRIKGRTI
ncbi:MAG: efflux RND transporter permease subunit, partial [Leptospiraceae bacterium]|nr:efflux RND transporter permease subunit [Leptospiraceae bacterium]